jgi:hypothetical protein
MTPLRKPVSRESTVRDAGRNVIVTIGPGDIISFRLKGCRKSVTTTLAATFHMAVKAEVAAKRAAKKGARR